MALTKDKKKQVVEEISKLLSDSNLVVMAKYAGTSVDSLQQLRKSGLESETSVKVIKNRLFIQALRTNPSLSNMDTEVFKNQLIYAFGQDEVAPAQLLANLAKTQPQVEFVGGFTDSGQILSVDDVKSLARLPSKDELRGQLARTIASPSSNFVRIISANISSILNVLSARAEKI